FSHQHQARDNRIANQARGPAIGRVHDDEQTGRIVPHRGVLRDYDEEVETAVESLVSLLEPLMIVILGGIIGFIVIALFLPLITLISKLSG
ncbi:MAG: type II secretion system F family protein, partial [Isosphaeraceae bacterium]